MRTFMLHTPLTTLAYVLSCANSFRGRRGLYEMAEFLDLRAAVEANVRDGDTVAMEGFTHLIPYAAGARGDPAGLAPSSTLVRMTPDLIYDQMIGMGLARKLIFS